MKIISKYKDYYDYLSGIYGVDPRLILNREGSNVPVHSGPSTGNLYSIHTFYICGLAYDYLIDANGNFIFGDDLKNVPGLKVDPYPHHRNGKTHVVPIRPKIATRWQELIHLNIKPVKTKINDLENCPIICQTAGRSEYYKWPILKDTVIPSLISAHDMWIKLSEWLSNKIIEPDQPIGSDKIRIESHGFDLKSSFRNV